MSLSSFCNYVLQKKKKKKFLRLTTLSGEAFENIVGKGENAGNQHFLFFPTMFSTPPKAKININFDDCKLYQIDPVQNFVIWERLNHILYTNPFPHKKFLDSFKLTEFADNNFKLDENGRKFTKNVENTGVVGEERRNCLLRPIFPFPKVFSKDFNCSEVKTIFVINHILFIYKNLHM